MEPTQNVVRLNVNLNEETAAALKLRAARRGQSVTETVRRAIAVLDFMDDVTDKGGNIMTEIDGVRRGFVIL